MERITTWRNYEEVAQYLLNQIADHFNLGHVEGKQVVPGKSGASWELDAKGVKSNGEGFLIIECKQHNSRLKQGFIGTLCSSIRDTGAQGGIIVSPLPLQSGAKKLAEFENIISVTLDSNCTNTDYILKFLNKIFVGLSETLNVSDCVSVKLIPGKDVNSKQP